MAEGSRVGVEPHEPGLLHELLVHQTADAERAFAINPERPAPTHELVMAFARQARASGLIQFLKLPKGEVAIDYTSIL